MSWDVVPATDHISKFHLILEWVTHSKHHPRCSILILRTGIMKSIYPHQDVTVTKKQESPRVSKPPCVKFWEINHPRIPAKILSHWMVLFPNFEHYLGFLITGSHHRYLLSQEIIGTSSIITTEKHRLIENVLFCRVDARCVITCSFTTLWMLTTLINSKIRSKQNPQTINVIQGISHANKLER